MLCLALDTSTKVCSVALLRDGVVALDRVGNPLCRMDRESGEHAKLLPVFADELLNELREQGEHLDAVAVSMGPGSYTGLRIGASFAKGLCYGLGIPLLPIDTLAILCEAAMEFQVSSSKCQVPVLCPMIDARRMEVYARLYDKGIPQGDVQAVVVDEHTFEDWLRDHHMAFFGDGAAKCQTVITSENAHFIADIVPDARYMGRLAEQAYAHAEPVDVAYWTPFYLKEYEAKHSVVKGLK